MIKRKILIAGNWKMNKGAGESLEFLESLIRGIESEKELREAIPDRILTAIFPQAVNLYPMKQLMKEESFVSLGIQNIHWEISGPLTGENSIPGSMESGAEFALVGHSERRHIFMETDEEIARKFGSCLKHGLKPVLCVGETVSERSRGETEAVISRQVLTVLSNPLQTGNIDELFVAYEPVWAIGTGDNATAADAMKCCGLIREIIGSLAGSVSAERVIVLYGGSVKSSNAGSYLEQDGIDGLLVGGASLDPGEFINILLVALSKLPGRCQDQ